MYKCISQETTEAHYENQYWSQADKLATLCSHRCLKVRLLYTILNLITTYTPTSAQSSKSIVFRWQPVYFLFLYKGRCGHPFELHQLFNAIQMSTHSEEKKHKKHTKTSHFFFFSEVYPWYHIFPVILKNLSTQGSNKVQYGIQDFISLMGNCKKGPYAKYRHPRRDKDWSEYSDRQAWANSVDPDQMPQNVASDQDLHCLPLSHYYFKYINR